MREKVKVYRREVADGGFSTREKTWALVGEWHAERVSQTSQVTMEAAEAFPDYRLTFRFSHLHSPKEHWMLETADGNRYDIVSVERNVGLRSWEGYTQVKCDRINQ